MFLRFVLALLLLGVSYPANAEEGDDYLMFVGKLKNSTQYPRDREEERARWSKMYPPNEGGEEQVIVSNHCGTEISKYEIWLALHGTKNKKKLKIRSLVGEWCQSNAPLTEDPVFLVATPYDSEFYGGLNYSLRSFEMKESENPIWLAYIDDPYFFDLCRELTGLDCTQFLRPIEPEFFGMYEEDNVWHQSRYEELNKLGIFTKNENNDIIIHKALLLDDLMSRMEKQ